MRRKRKSAVEFYKDNSSSTSRISTASMRSALERLKTQTRRSTTKANYLGIWRNFNNFVIKLDSKPDNWEDRISLFGTFLIENGIQSCTLKSYYSAIKAILKEDDYIVDDNKVLLSSLVKACRLENDRVRTRLPIKIKLLEILLFEVQRVFHQQPYLEALYTTILLLCYYGLFRIGELTTGSHPVKAADVHIGKNKDKMLFILHSSKTHGPESRPQKIKIAANPDRPKINTFFCPFKAARHYLAMRGNYQTPQDPFFIFRDQQPVQPSHVRKVLKDSLKAVNLDPTLYGCHSLRIARAGELVKFGESIERVKLAGRWRSNIVYKYIRNCHE